MAKKRKYTAIPITLWRKICSRVDEIGAGPASKEFGLSSTWFSNQKNRGATHSKPGSGRPETLRCLLQWDAKRSGKKPRPGVAERVEFSLDPIEPRADRVSNLAANVVACSEAMRKIEEVLSTLSHSDRIRVLSFFVNA